MWPWESYQWASVFLIYPVVPSGLLRGSSDLTCILTCSRQSMPWSRSHRDTGWSLTCILDQLPPSLRQLFQTVSKHICPKKLPALPWASCWLLSCPLASSLQGDVSPLLPTIHSHGFFVWSSIRSTNCSVTDPSLSHVFKPPTPHYCHPIA